jgi:hypothetical protein
MFGMSAAAAAAAAVVIMQKLQFSACFDKNLAVT